MGCLPARPGAIQPARTRRRRRCPVTLKADKCHPYLLRFIKWRETAWWVTSSDVPGYWLFWDEHNPDGLNSFLVQAADVERAVAAGDMTLDSGADEDDERQRLQDYLRAQRDGA